MAALARIHRDQHAQPALELNDPRSAGAPVEKQPDAYESGPSFGRRAANATKFAGVGLATTVALGAGIYFLAPSVIMYLAATHFVQTLAAPAAVLGAAAGYFWDD